MTGVGDEAEVAHTARPDATIVKLYQLAVEMADRVSARRAMANTFFLAIQAAITTLIGALYPLGSEGPPEAPRPIPLASLLAAVAGAILAVAWWLSLRTYRDLNRAKFSVINDIERQLPVQIYTQEWRILKPPERVGWRKRYTELGQVERVVPAIFLLLYLAAIAMLLWKP